MAIKNKFRHMKKYFLFVLLVALPVITSAQEVKVNESFENITEIDINLIFSDVEVEAVSGNTVSVEGLLEWSHSKDEYEIIVQKKGTTLVVEVDHPRNSRGKASGKFHIKAPTLTDVKINTVSGNMRIVGVGQRLVKFNTVSGDIVAEKIGSDLKGNTVSGDVMASHIKGHINLSTISGDQTISDVDGNFKGSSISGDFKISNLKGNREISTISGSVR